jgi:hypothetical protein
MMRGAWQLICGDRLVHPCHRFEGYHTLPRAWELPRLGAEPTGTCSILQPVLAACWLKLCDVRCTHGVTLRRSTALTLCA